MPNFTTLQVEARNHVGLIWFNRPEIHNALNDVVLGELRAALKAMARDRGVRALVLAGHGKSFCAGGDLNYMKRAAGYTKAQNERDAAALAETLWILASLPKPTVARVHGNAYAGGMGFVAACDIAVASTEAVFCLSEVKLGLIPATISPYVIRAMGERAASRYFLTAERFDAAEAYRIGFVQDICPPDELDARVNEVLGHLVQGGPRALAESKKLLALSGGTRLTPAVRGQTAKMIAATRASAEGREGIASFLEKRKPAWVNELQLGEQ
ncbi:MAG: enoyl-CoA hydratase/isomerase family protein [Burkholderiales bacterium]|nr:enoyl-CoA hydratase/isomerase family protein [Burkholderiales bacterium]